jgi:PAS domain S-box-containing protein
MIEIAQALGVDGQAVLEALFEDSADGVKLFDTHGALVAINGPGVSLLGFDQASQILGRRWSEYLPPELGELARTVFEDVRGGQSTRLSVRLPKGVAGAYCEITAIPLRTEHGEVSAVLVITRDVTALVAARKKAESREQALRRKTAALRAAGQLARLGAWELDLVGRTLYLSAEFWAVLECPPQRLTIDEAVAFIEPEDVEALRQRVFQARDGLGAFTTDVRLRHPTQAVFWARIVGDLDPASGRLRGAVQDVSDRQRAEFALMAALDAAEGGARAKSAFLANMSHEIRTPLHGILGMAQVMGQHALTPDQVERLGVIRQSGDVLMALLNDILDLSKIEAGMLKLEERIFEIHAAIEAACAPFRYLAFQKDVAFDLQVAATAQGAWRGDDLRLRQVVANLVSNAVKFTAAGEVRVSAEHDGQALVIAVDDTGIGLDPSQIERLFQAFTQGDGEVTRQYGGTGLGLPISAHLTSLMGGAITVSAAPGAGCRFEVRLPLVKAGDSRPDVATGLIEAPVRGMRILAAEDNPTNQLILRSMIAPLDADLTLVEDGEAAVEAFALASFDLVLMDIQMPRLNGVEAARRIRRLEAARQRVPTPILALSANVMAHQVAEYHAAGMDGVVEKPIDIAVLFATINAALSGELSGPLLA